MTRKDYTLIASVFVEQLRITNLLVLPSTERDRVMKVAIAMAERLGSTNPNFDRDGFLTACGVNP
jgi:hypothetical protein